MIAQKSQPALGFLPSSFGFEHVLANRVWARRIQPKQHQVPVDGFRAPQDILTTQASDQGSRFWADGWTASFPPRFPPPPLQQGTRMPLENASWVSSGRLQTSIRPTPLTQHPQETKCRVKSRTGLSLLPDTFFVEGELTSNRNQFTSQ